MKKIDLVLVEDNPNDAHILMRILKKEGLTESIEWLKDGADAVESLVEKEEWLPKLILLDIKLPKLNGFEVLRKLRNKDRTNKVPILMLSSSNQLIDIRTAYANGANGFLTKPDKYSDFKILLKSVADFWLNQNKTTHNP